MQACKERRFSFSPLFPPFFIFNLFNFLFPSVSCLHSIALLTAACHALGLYLQPTTLYSLLSAPLPSSCCILYTAYCILHSAFSCHLSSFSTLCRHACAGNMPFPPPLFSLSSHSSPISQRLHSVEVLLHCLHLSHRRELHRHAIKLHGIAAE
mmetsp:Transcript_49289/g.127109  ORF Transcript_49289/g.127109 Transcript_49289/m.127109 type:complete len:153 (+) Transcript_49289:395-853(+)